jgi:PAS domain S-box-containing protein
MLNTFIGGGEMGERIRSFDWTQTPLGPIETWPQALKTAVQIMLTSRQPFWLGWGEHLIKLYNDAYKTIVGGKHPAALGQPAAVVWREIWDAIGPMLTTAMGGTEGTYVEAQLLIMERNGYPEETYYTFSYSPIPNDQGGVGGIICANTDDTQRVIGERQLALLRDLAARTVDARTVAEACALSTECLAANPYDLPFAMIYLAEPEAQRVVLAGKGSGIEWGHPAAPEMAPLGNAAIWPFAEVLATNQAGLVSDLSAVVPSLPRGAWDHPPHQAVAMPIAPQGPTGKAGILVVGLNPYRLFDEQYRGFLELVAAQIAASIANAQAYEEERQRAKALAELDRAKTDFFSNVSHEFRTPLTLMLGPLEDTLAQSARLDAEDRERLDIAHRNALRLLRLVNMLLDFSRIEAGRIQASYAPTDLAALTADVASVFRSAVERAGVRLVVACAPLSEPAYIDHEMWEKVVLNLLSNAFKFTFAGEIEVSLRQAGAMAELVVRDTGIGIPPDELPHLFERFHRVKGARGRTFEGSGIGLALVQELVKLHGGSVRVESEINRGSTFTVTVPLGTAHLPAERIDTTPTLTPAVVQGEAYLEEALRWVPEPEARDVGLAAREDSRNDIVFDDIKSQAPSLKPRILLADDNVDMREYVQRLLNQEYEVVAVSDGMAALRAVREAPFDLVLTDVMMPHLDGFGLLAALRSAEQTKTLPVILLSARAGEESRIEGMEAGADDYLVKPFSAKELRARVGAHLEMARVRREAARLERELRAEAQAARELLEEVLAGVSDQLLALDRDWRYVFLNERVTEITGRRREELLGKSIWEVFPETVDTEFEHEMRRAVAERAPVQFAYFYPPWNRWFENRAYPSASGVTIFVTDITDHKRAEAERARQLEQEQRLRAQAEEASRLKDEFLATVSHELRTPLTSLLGYAQMLQRRTYDEAYVVRTVEKLVRSAKDQAQIIDDLLDVSRVVNGKLRIEMQLIDLGAVVRASLDTVRPAIDAKGIHLHIDLRPEAGTIMGDANRLQQVIWNLLANATKFTPAGGGIEVRLERHGRDARLTVSDTGQGISAEFLPYVFDRFRQADGTSNRVHGGLGLGLAIVRHLVELHGGIVQATSAGPGQGATFTVCLPLAADGTAKLLGTATGAADNSRADEPYTLELDGLRVLVVDDQPDILDLLHEILTPSGAVVRMCQTAPEALDALSTWQPDVLISDIAMPGEDGY